MQRTKVEEQWEGARGDGGKLSVERLRMGDERLPRTRDEHEKAKAKPVPIRMKRAEPGAATRRYAGPRFGFPRTIA